MTYYRFLGRNGRTTIPLEIRAYLDLADHDMLSFTVEEDTVVIRREQVCDNCVAEATESFEDLFNMLPIQAQQALVADLAKRLLENKKGGAHGNH